MNRRFFYCFIMMFLLVISPSLGLSLGSLKISPVMYRPGTMVSNDYTISGTDRPVEVSAHSAGNVFKHVTVSEVVDNRFTLTIDFPKEEYVPPGAYIITVSAREALTPEEQDAGGISALVGVSKTIEVIVYATEKDVNAALTVPNINQGSDLEFQLGVQSVSYADIASVHGEISVYDTQGKELGKVTTEHKPLPSLEGITFKTPFEASALPVASYSANATVFYDGKQETANANFLIGNMDVLLKDYSKNLTSGFSEFKATVASNWGNPLRNVYAKVFLNDEELLQTPSINLEPWQEGTLKGIMKLDLSPGEHTGILKLFFEGEGKQVPIIVNVLPETGPTPTLASTSEVKQEVQEAKPSLLVPGIVAFVIFTTLIVIVLLRRKRREGVSDDF